VYNKDENKFSEIFMRNNNRRPFKERVASYMVGRYGIDRLYYFLLAICFSLLVINIFLNSFVISFLESALIVFAFYRVMSRNIYKRQQENEKFIKFIDKPKKFINLQKCKRRDRDTHVYRKCPSCKNNLRLPKEKGKHIVVCPCCKNRFDVRI
jgi:predicted membrane protein